MKKIHVFTSYSLGLMCRKLCGVLERSLINVIDMQKIFEESLSEWMNQAPDNTKIKTPSGETIPRELLAHSEILLLRYHEALRQELAKQGIHFE